MTDWTEIGIGDHPSQNPPALEESDRYIIRFCEAYANEFVRDFGVMGSLIESLRMNGRDKELFIRKVNLLYQRISGINERANG